MNKKYRISLTIFALGFLITSIIRIRECIGAICSGSGIGTFEYLFLPEILTGLSFVVIYLFYEFIVEVRNE